MTDSGIPSEEAFGEPTVTQEDPPESVPEQTDNRPRDEDGDQDDVTQNPEPAEGSV